MGSNECPFSLDHSRDGVRTGRRAYVGRMAGQSRGLLFANKKNLDIDAFQKNFCDVLSSYGLLAVFPYRGPQTPHTPNNNAMPDTQRKKGPHPLRPFSVM